MPVVAAVLGAGLVVLALRDVFHTLWHPGGRGNLSSLVMKLLWRLPGPAGRRGRAGTLAGPLAMLAVIAIWGSLIVAGYALIYWPHMDAGFVFATGLRSLDRDDLLDAVYLSLVTLATLGFGDIVPAEGWLRVAAPLQALIGFALLTASVSWVLQIYPALARRRALSIRLALLGRAHATARIPELDSTTAAQLLESLAISVVEVRVDLTQYSATYYFREADPRASLASTLGYALELVEAGEQSTLPGVRLAATVLGGAVDDLTQILDQQFLHLDADRRDVVEAYAAEHAHARR